MSVCVDFLHTLLASDPSFNCCMFMSKKANFLEFSNSLVNFVAKDTLFT